MENCKECETFDRIIGELRKDINELTLEYKKSLNFIEQLIYLLNSLPIDEDGSYILEEAIRFHKEKIGYRPKKNDLDNDNLPF